MGKIITKGQNSVINISTTEEGAFDISATEQSAFDISATEQGALVANLVTLQFSNNVRFSPEALVGL